MRTCVLLSDHIVISLRPLSSLVRADEGSVSRRLAMPGRYRSSRGTKSKRCEQLNPGDGPRSDGDSYSLADLLASSSRRSRRFWPVGPVTTESPNAVNSGQALNSASEACGSKP